MGLNTSSKGNSTSGVILAKLLALGYQVLTPFGDGGRYDLAFDDGKQIRRVQCKTGRIFKGVVVFSASSMGRNGKRTDYAGGADLFGVYCPQNDTVYLVPVADCPVTAANLRIQETLNNQTNNVRWAKAYEAKDVPPAWLTPGI